MGEIRSTLDIIMEKAKRVEVTEEDKAAFMRREVEGKIRGSLQKALDGFIDAQGLQSEIEVLGADRHEIAVAALRRECLERMVLEGDILTQERHSEPAPETMKHPLAGEGGAWLENALRASNGF